LFPELGRGQVLGVALPKNWLAMIMCSSPGCALLYCRGGEYSSGDYYSGSEADYKQGGDYEGGKHTACANIMLAHGKIDVTFNHKGAELDYSGRVTWVLNYQIIDPSSGDSTGPSSGDYGYGHSGDYYNHQKVDDSPCHDNKPVFPINTLSLKLHKEDEDSD
jgi:hypothetical protein